MSAGVSEENGGVVGYPYGPQQGQGYPPGGQQGYQPGGYPAPGPGGPGYGTPGHGTPGYGAPGHGTPGYGGPGYGAPGHGNPQYGIPGYGAPQGAVSGATGILAAVLALVLSLISLAGAVVSYNSPLATECTGKLVQLPDGTFACSSTSLTPLVTTFLVIGAIIGVLLLTGSILLFLRKTAGRVIVIVVSTLSALGGVASLVSMADAPVTSDAGMTISGVQAAVAILMLVLAAAPSTGRWIRAAQRRPDYPQGNYQRY
ncbi:hypothetical protein ACFWPK_31020 [Nocardia sp. NPDC058519]|uniref:hypothetical protein n=1 Tax=Nocardia sp. NPDC058519 TaxID=3346535 RepID=UPI00365FEA00